MSSTSLDSFVAWSLYTGPSEAQPLWPNSRWITGQWNGDTDLRTDIDMRVDAAVSAFKAARKDVEGSKCPLRVFAIPEFYFHSQCGPYSYTLMEGLGPFKYICASFQEKLSAIAFDEGESWLICTGSVLTCNVSDIDAFLASDVVTSRLAELNAAIGRLEMNRDLCLPNNTHIKAKGYMEALRYGNDPEGAVNSLMTNYRGNPLCTVRNRGAIFTVGSEGVQCLKYEKQNESTVDLTMGLLIERDGVKQIEMGGMITEWLGNYPSITLYSGDKNMGDNPYAARMSIDGVLPETMQLGVEICLDHRLQRLRRTIGMCKANGAAADNPALQVQLVPSGGMQILSQSTSAGAGGVIFNADGCDPLLYEYTSTGKQIIPGPGKYKGMTCGVYASCAQAMVETTQKYYSHSQLCFRYGESEIGGYNNAEGNKNAEGPTFDIETKKNPALDIYAAPEIKKVLGPSIDELYAAGSGDLHIYKKAN